MVCSGSSSGIVLPLLQHVFHRACQVRGRSWEGESGYLYYVSILRIYSTALSSTTATVTPSAHYYYLPYTGYPARDPALGDGSPVDSVDVAADFLPLRLLALPDRFLRIPRCYLYHLIPCLPLSSWSPGPLVPWSPRPLSLSVSLQALPPIYLLLLLSRPPSPRRSWFLHLPLRAVYNFVCSSAVNILRLF